MLFFPCCGQKFFKMVKDEKNLTEIIDFKNYLEEVNAMDDFKQNKVISSSTDSTINKFLIKYNIIDIHILKCNKYKFSSPDNHFTECGNIVELTSGIPLINTQHSLIFDYSEIKLKLKDGIKDSKHKIADRIYVF